MGVLHQLNTLIFHANCKSKQTFKTENICLPEVLKVAILVLSGLFKGTMQLKIQN